MGCSWLKKCSLVLIIVCQIVACVRISPKLDFGNDASDNAKLRSTFPNRPSSFVNEKHSDFVCASGNCTAKQNGVATDITVHIKTKVDEDAKNNSNTAVPDIPVIIGTRTNEITPFNSAPNVYDLPPPLPVGTFIQNRVQQTAPQANNGFDYNYASGYQSNNANLYPVYNEQNQNTNNLPLPQFTPYNPKRIDGEAHYNHNPLQFKKVYQNYASASPREWTENRFSAPVGSRPSNWGPCLCQNPQEQYYQAGYPAY